MACCTRLSAAARAVMRSDPPSAALHRARLGDRAGGLEAEAEEVPLQRPAERRLPQHPSMAEQLRQLLPQLQPRQPQPPWRGCAPQPQARRAAQVHPGVMPTSTAPRVSEGGPQPMQRARQSRSDAECAQQAPWLMLAACHLPTSAGSDARRAQAAVEAALERDLRSRRGVVAAHRRMSTASASPRRLCARERTRRGGDRARRGGP